VAGFHKHTSHNINSFIPYLVTSVIFIDLAHLCTDAQYVNSFKFNESLHEAFLHHYKHTTLG